jgi:hypothetical protein
MAKPNNGEVNGNSKKNSPILDDVSFTLDENTGFAATIVGRDPDKKDVLSYSFSNGLL